MRQQHNMCIIVCLWGKYWISKRQVIFKLNMDFFHINFPKIWSVFEENNCQLFSLVCYDIEFSSRIRDISLPKCYAISEYKWTDAWGDNISLILCTVFAFQSVNSFLNFFLSISLKSSRKIIAGFSLVCYDIEFSSR